MSRVRRPRKAGRRAAENELLRLHEKLDLADAAASELDVVAGDRDLVVPAHGMDLPLHRMHVGDGGEVEIFAPDEWRVDRRENARPAQDRRRRGAP